MKCDKVNCYDKKFLFFFHFQGSSSSRILFVAATRHPFAVDKALRIPGNHLYEIKLLELTMYFH